MALKYIDIDPVWGALGGPPVPDEFPEPRIPWKYPPVTLPRAQDYQMAEEQQWSFLPWDKYARPELPEQFLEPLHIPQSEIDAAPPLPTVYPTLPTPPPPKPPETPQAPAQWSDVPEPYGGWGGAPAPATAPTGAPVEERSTEVEEEEPSKWSKLAAALGRAGAALSGSGGVGGVGLPGGAGGGASVLGALQAIPPEYLLPLLELTGRANVR